MTLSVALPPPLDRDFVPAALWNRAYREQVASDPGSRIVKLTLMRPDGTGFSHDTRVLAADHPEAALTLRYAERLLKFLLWQKGATRVHLEGAPEIAAQLADIYSSAGARRFDRELMGDKIYRDRFFITAAPPPETATEAGQSTAIGRHLDGCRIGFDLGGSDRKAAALIDGRVVFSEEIPWDPYFQTDPTYHINGVHDSLRRAAAHLPRVDAIGGSAAGIYVNNEVRVGSLFRGVPPEQFDAHIRQMFFTLQERWGGIPFEVANDGDVTALAGSMALNANAVLGLSLGTSTAGGYVTPAGGITSWLNELAFVPVDFRDDAPRDEWSGDAGCGVQYFSQQAVARLAPIAGFALPENLPLAERLVAVQQAMQAGDARAVSIFQTLGSYLGYTIAHFADFYEFRHLLVLGRVTSGPGGNLILDTARLVLAREFPALAQSVQLHLPGEKDRRHGQAVAAASLPRLNGRSFIPR